MINQIQERNKSIDKLYANLDNVYKTKRLVNKHRELFTNNYTYYSVLEYLSGARTDDLDNIHCPYWSNKEIPFREWYKDLLTVLEHHSNDIEYIKLDWLDKEYIRVLKIMFNDPYKTILENNNKYPFMNLNIFSLYDYSTVTAGGVPFFGEKYRKYNINGIEYIEKIEFEKDNDKKNVKVLRWS